MQIKVMTLVLLEMEDSRDFGSDVHLGLGGEGWLPS